MSSAQGGSLSEAATARFAGAACAGLVLAVQAVRWPLLLHAAGEHCAPAVGS